MKPLASTLGWWLAGALVVFGALSVVFHFQPQQTLAERFATQEEKLALTGQLRAAIASAAEAEKSAVLANSDEDSMLFAKQAKAATALAEERRRALVSLLAASGTTREQELSAELTKAFAEFRRVDDELLELAVRNSNVKASALAYGPAADAIAQLDGALAEIIDSAANQNVAVTAARAEAAALRMQALLPKHIAEESEPKMDALEARMSSEWQAVRVGMAALASLLPSGNSSLATAQASYAVMTGLKAQIILLSRENTNVRSLSLSLNQKRKVTLVCEDALVGLERAIAEQQAATKR